MAFRPLLDFLFPAQCASCSSLGSGFCDACASHRETIRVAFPGLRVTAYGAYERSLRSAILALKDGRRDVAQALGRLAATLIPAASTIVPVPTTAKRRRVRGLDGVALVAQCAASITGAAFRPALTQCGGAQQGRTRTERLAARGRFSCTPINVAAGPILLFDDVCTTGATLRDCADAVREAGGRVEDAVVIAATKTAAPWGAPTLN